MQTRPAFGGNLMATIVCRQARPQMATVRPGVMKALDPEASRQGEVVTIPVQLDERAVLTKIVEIIQQEDEGQVNLQDAQIIVSGGRGLGKPENFALIRELAEALGGAVGASRAAVDAGWIPAYHQVGQTGRTVQPKALHRLRHLRGGAAPGRHGQFGRASSPSTRTPSRQSSASPPTAL